MGDNVPLDGSSSGTTASAAAAAKFPWLPIFTLCCCSFATCINQTTLYPIGPYYILDAGMVDDPREPGEFAGYLTSSGQIGRLLFSMYWGRFSDRHGRKVVLQISLLTTVVTAIAPTAVGTSTVATSIAATNRSTTHRVTFPALFGNCARSASS